MSSLSVRIYIISRWHLELTGILADTPHASTEDDIHDGLFIPKGSLILPSICKFTHDPAVYHEPMKFSPELFLVENGSWPEPDPRAYVFASVAGEQSFRQMVYLLNTINLV